MSYIDGFVLAVPTENLEKYRKIAEQAGKVWMEHGALQYKECVGEDLRDKGFCATFPDSFGAKEGETMMFSFIEYKSRAHRDEVNAKVMADPRLHEMCDADNMPFDIKRMAFGGFSAIVKFG